MIDGWVVDEVDDVLFACCGVQLSGMILFCRWIVIITAH